MLRYRSGPAPRRRGLWGRFWEGLPFCFALWILWSLAVEVAPVNQTPDLDQLVSRNAISFRKYDFLITCAPGNRLRIRTRVDLALTASRDGACYFMLADIYGTKIKKLTINGWPVAYRHWNDFYIFRLPGQLPPNQKIRMELDYEIISKFSSRLVYAELSGAWYPKSLFAERGMAEFTLEVPAGMVGIANGELTAVQNAPHSTRYRWRTERPQTNLAVSIGRYNSFVRLIHYRTYRIYAPQSLEADSRRLSLWASLIGERYHELFGGADYHGLTLVINDTTLDDTSFGALIFLHPGQNQPLTRKFYKLAHEIAHFWWGNLIIPKTPQDWWLAEGFANYSAFLICEQAKMLRNEQLAAAISTWRQPAVGNLPVLKPQAILAEWQIQYHNFLADLQNYQISEMALAEIGPFDFQRELLYSKGAYVLHMARTMLGDANFFRLIRLFVADYQMKQAGVRDFTKMGNSLYGTQLADYFRQWVYSAGAYDMALQNITIMPLLTRTPGGTFRKYQLRFKIVTKGQLYLPDLVDLEICTATQIHHEVLYFKGVNVTILKTYDEPPRQIKLNGLYRVLEANLSDNVWTRIASDRDFGKTL